MRINNDSTRVRIGERDLEAGLQHLTLFDESLKPVAERLFFIYPDRSDPLSISLDKISYKEREKVELKVNNLMKDKTDLSEMSLAVYQYNEELDKLSIDPSVYFHLQSELGRPIDDPAYFFESSSLSRKLELDEVIMTYGWRKFAWEDILADEPHKPDYLAEIRAPLLGGYFVDGDSLQGKSLMALFPGKEPQLYTFELGEDNDFNFEISPEIKSGDILFWSDEVELGNYELELNTYFEKADSALYEKQLSFDQEMLDFIQEYAVGIQVNNSYALENNSRGMIDPTIGIRNAFYGEPDVRYVLDDYNRFPTLDEVFLEYVRFATARKKNGVERLYVKDLDYGSVGYDNPAFTLIDGVPINDLNYIWEFDQAEVENIEIVSRMYNQGSKEFYGVINLTTFKGNLGGNTVPDYLIQRLYKGIQQPREFYSPVYDIPSQDHRLPDYRSLLTWEPDLQRDEDGNFRTSFYTSDQHGKFMVEVMGISKSGVVVSDRKLMEVKLSNAKP